LEISFPAEKIVLKGTTQPICKWAVATTVVLRTNAAAEVALKLHASAAL
jgi:hypothetical protein